jgi:hypothetical protein
LITASNARASFKTPPRRLNTAVNTKHNGECGEVTGTGRYPARDLRPRSRFSLKTESNDALDELLETIAKQGAKAILTFPDHECSNGLSGASVRKIARKHFSVVEESVDSDFSTLGGTSSRGFSERSKTVQAG